MFRLKRGNIALCLRIIILMTVLSVYNAGMVCLSFDFYITSLIAGILDDKYG